MCFSTPTGTSAMVLHCPLSASASDDLDLGLEPEVTVELAEAFDDNNLPDVGSVNHSSNTPDLPLPSSVQLLEDTVATAIATIMGDVPLAQLATSTAPSRLPSPPPLTSEDS